MNESDEDYVQRMFRQATAFPDDAGLRGPAPRVKGVRDILGTTGGKGGSYAVDVPPQVPELYPGSAQDTSSNGGVGTIPNIIVTLSGVRYYADVQGVLKDPVT